MRPWLACVVALAAGCYDPAKPECGFICGPDSACPTEYTCSKMDNRCHRTGTDVSCEGLQDAFVDATGDHAPPQITSRIPARDEVGVAVDATVFVTFDEQVFGFSDSSFTLLVNGIQVPALLGYEPFSFRATLDPLDQLAADQPYVVNLSSQITDASGNPLPAESWSFITGPDTSPPGIRSTSPQAGTVAPGTSTIIVVFDELALNVDASSFLVTSDTGPISGSVSTPDGRTFLFTPPVELPLDQTIVVSLTPAITDLAGNALPPGTGFQFTTFARL